MRKLITEATAASGHIERPNISRAMMPAAMGVLAAPARTATNPRAAKVGGSRSKIWAKRVPDVAPTKKIGVTIPPLPPKLSVTDVNADLTADAYHGTAPPRSADSMVSRPRPRKRGPVRNVAAARAG